EMALESEGIVDVTKGVITYEKIIHRPVVSLTYDASDKDYDQLHKLVYQAEKSCMISRAVKGNVAVKWSQRSNKRASEWVLFLLVKFGRANIFLASSDNSQYSIIHSKFIGIIYILLHTHIAA